MCSKNEHDFASLIGGLLTTGWTWSDDPPTETQLLRWAAVGRAEYVLEKKKETTTGRVRRRLSLLRAKHESAPRAYHSKIRYVSEWSAWETVEDPSETPWTF